MARTWIVLAAIATFGTAAFSQQGGAVGGGGLGGGAGFGQGAGQGGAQQQYDRSVQSLTLAISSYLDGPEVTAILTPGEYTEWLLTLKAGQVVIAEARSDFFDAALEIVDPEKNVIAENDDRFPGDQRPLLMWRCEDDGTYGLRCRSWRDKAGGQLFLRFRIYESIDLFGGEFVEREFDTRGGGILLRVPMSAGQVKQVRFDRPDGRYYSPPQVGQVISPVGLPDIGLSNPLSDAMRNTIVAPVDGDYYVFVNLPRSTAIRLKAAAVEVPARLLSTDNNSSANGAAPNNNPALWKLSVKKGDILEASTPELFPTSALVVAEVPDFSKYDLDDPEANPFYPKPINLEEQDEGPAFVALPARARDGRVAVFVARRDTEVWLASSGVGVADGEFTMSVRPATRPFADGTQRSSRLRIGDTDYWAFDANVGDVMTLASSATAFASDLVVMDPDLQRVWSSSVLPDQTDLSGNLIIRRPGRYLAAMSAIGHGGGGDYTLVRQVFGANAFDKDSPARGEISSGDVQVWKLTATPGEPLLLRLQSTKWTYSISVQREDGERATLPMTPVDDNNRYGILKVDRPTTFLIVLIGTGERAHYSMDVMDLPGYRR